jgi:hypothetical protein
MFNDIDLFKLEGVGRMDSVSYPFIRVVKTGADKRRVVYQSSEKDSAVRDYWRDGNYWTTRYRWLSDTGYFTTYQFILPQKIIELNYRDTAKYSDFILHDGSLIKTNSEVAYSFAGDRGISIRPGIDAIDSIRGKVSQIITDDFVIDKGILTCSAVSVDKKDTSYNEKYCFQVGDHSTFWWRQFGAKSVNCEN